MAKVSIPELLEKKRKGEKVTCMTAYDYQTARILDKAGVEVILVGDSGGRYILGHTDNNACTMDEMLLMSRSVARGTEHAFVVGDLPFMSYQVNIEEAVRNAGRFIKEAGADGVKLEGGKAYAPTVAAIVRAGVPVMGHMGLTPMTTMGMGLVGYDQPPPESDIDELIEDARALEAAGAFSLVLTRVNAEASKRITEAVDIFTLGGAHANGAVGVIYGLLGMEAQHIDSGRSRYGPVARALYDAACAYLADARTGRSRQEAVG
jgi:3-methyl-2-oxobutanoate hydroxymethyltransferase